MIDQLPKGAMRDLGKQLHYWAKRCEKAEAEVRELRAKVNVLSRKLKQVGIKILLMLLLVSPAMAKELTVTDQEQTAIQQICDVASTNQNIPRDTRAGIAQFCVVWAKKITDTKVDPPDGKGPQEAPK